jgi:DNA repair and recombination protein RAD54B
LESRSPPIGLIICDEGLWLLFCSFYFIFTIRDVGHRLKSANNKTAAMFKTLDTRRRIILSGTPIQNDLGEFHAMVSSPFQPLYANSQINRRNSAILGY